MARTPVLLGEAADPKAGADDAEEDKDHPDQHDEMSEVFAQRKARHGLLASVRDDVVHDEVEKKPEGHHDEPEAGDPREWERRNRERMVQRHTSGRLYC